MTEFVGARPVNLSEGINSGYLATATFTPAAAAYSAGNIISTAQNFAWKSTGASNAYTADGIHPSNTGQGDMATPLASAMSTWTLAGAL